MVITAQPLEAAFVELYSDGNNNPVKFMDRIGTKEALWCEEAGKSP